MKMNPDDKRIGCKFDREDDFSSGWTSDRTSSNWATLPSCPSEGAATALFQVGRFTWAYVPLSLSERSLLHVQAKMARSGLNGIWTSTVWGVLSLELGLKRDRTYRYSPELSLIGNFDIPVALVFSLYRNNSSSPASQKLSFSDFRETTLQEGTLQIRWSTLSINSI